MKPDEVLALVEDQFREMRRQLDVTIQRMGQLQAQMDSIHGMVKSLCAED